MARSIMIQGTASNAGKSLLCAGLCRIFRQDGYKAAPFKAQNMALNSAVTPDGLEMGRAQAVQAQAAGIDPDVRMNPILLKPTGEMGSQVIVNGAPVGTMSAADYFSYRRQLIPKVMEAYHSLEGEYDILVLEGAGSPAEINLRRDDIVNMGMARRANSPVLLCGDIDRGGVFAALYGTVALLEREEQELIRGLVINKFRGDVEILRPGLAQLEGLTGKPVVGVVPMLEVDVDDEDSLSARLEGGKARGVLDVAVIRLPRISNFTDFNPLERMGEIALRYVRRAEELGIPDLVILPGTKSTMEDLRWLRACGLAEAILAHAARGGAVCGICGGYQMLCRTLSDPEGAEGGGSMPGLGLLEGETVFLPRKTRRRVTGRFRGAQGIFAPLNGAPFRGYEIHMGITRGEGAPLAQLESGEGESRPDGLAAGNVWGCYVHGLFDQGAAAAALRDALLARRGLPPGGGAENGWDYAQGQYDALADALRQALDMEKIYEILDRRDSR